MAEVIQILELIYWALRVAQLVIEIVQDLRQRSNGARKRKGR